MTTSDEYTRLSVNMNAETVRQLQEMVASKGISYTEAVRRAIAITAYVQGEIAKGRTILSVEGKDAWRLELCDE